MAGSLGWTQVCRVQVLACWQGAGYPEGTLCVMGAGEGALKGGEDVGFDSDYPAKIHFLLVMTGWRMLESQLPCSTLPSH